MEKYFPYVLTNDIDVIHFILFDRISYFNSNNKETLSYGKERLYLMMRNVDRKQDISSTVTKSSSKFKSAFVI